ncbi:translation initiation factor IF-2 [Hyphococcus sp.]|uniref:translation initiation factor IF-2 n=1 Tax=Hyphococcus sp. TaxID=2038636 RepID=UPI003D0EBC70
MSDDVETETSKPRRPLTLRRTETGAVKQSFSHGRSKTVVVETKKRRVLSPKKGGEAPETSEAKEAPEKKSAKKPADDKAAAARAAAAAKEAEDRKKGAVLRTLSDDEKQARAAALATARKEKAERDKRDAAERAEREAREAEERARLEEERRRQAIEEEKRAREADERRKAEEAAREALEEEERERKKRNAAKADARAKGREDVETPAAPDAEPDNPLAQLGGRLKTKRKGAGDDRREAGKAKEAPRRRSGKLTIANALDDEERQRSLASVKRAREREKLARQQRGGDRVVRDVVIPETITVQELAARMSMRAVDLVKELMKQGQMVTANAVLDADTAQLVAEDLGHSVKRVAEADVEEGLGGAADTEDQLKPRPPVVTIMGHVDHGKTSLLDAMRQTDVVAGEAGGITQHIGAYQVDLGDDRKITFLDTPGHAAFTQMRARGAKVTDIIVLVVAADDSIMPQTEEAISHAKAAGVPIIVAINKVDKPDANPQKVRTDLLQHEIQVESMGGEVQDVEVSALKKMNLDGLQEAILLQAELLDLKANPDRPADGAVVEARLDKGRGPVATFLVERGSLKRGDIIVVGAEWGKVRAMTDDKGQTVNEAGPAYPVEVLGLNGVPEPGDTFNVVDSEARAREIAEFRQRQRREKAAAKSSGTSLEQMMAQLQDSEIKELPIVIKGDVQGSIEAIVGSLEKLNTDEVRVRVLHTGVGGISESDVILAEASNAPVIGFNVRANKQARDEAERSKVEIRYYSVIYNLIDDIKATLSGMLDPELRETFLGNAEILEVFSISKHGKVAGCRVTEGKVARGAKVRLIRDNVVIHEGELSQLKRFKDDVNEVPAGQECGMSFANYEDMRPGDVIECFSVEKVTRTL